MHTADTPPFVDGGAMIARGGFFTRDGKWAVENEGVAPDIEVENWPKDVIAGKDPQLERAVEEAMRLLKAKPVDRLTTERRRPGVRANVADRTESWEAGQGDVTADGRERGEAGGRRPMVATDAVSPPW